MDTKTPIADEMGSFSERYAGAHRSGSFTTETMREIERVVRHIELNHTAETGCGKTTILFSQLSAEHTIFTVDDRQYGEESSLGFVLEYPKTRRETLRAVFGPTQKTLPRHVFDAPLDCVFIDGPHGFPFPEIEYYFFYPHLREGALLFINDLNIPTTAKFWEVVSEDRMFEVAEIIGTLGVLRRTGEPAFDPFGDHWWLQRYNQRRKPDGPWGPNVD